ncbi:aerobic glycerol-3-phosphate dehydrogenase [Salmonella enterica subsp. enterica]|uniref:Aerobic glycerol-3-phosphate dehydrogenase n=1 Tax=Salmonella enterica I TaxID=59201 RepID=A0A447TTK7_SALET|nr:aerobic glycerol-3-phosphate dehydrogenase [Salmonella enterica subsp. enterica]
MLEAQDLACATSSASSKLIHGGLRYLEHYEFRLVSEALAEREVLLKMAPHIAFPMRFRLPHRPALTSGLDDPYRSVYVRSPRQTYQFTRFHRVCGLAQIRYSNLKSCADSNTPTAG